MGAKVFRAQQAKDTGALPSGCSMAGLLEMLTRPWTLHILWLLSTNGPMRFGALKRSAEGISARLLTVRLRTLESEGFVHRTVRSGKTPEVTYAPTAMVAEMNEVMAQLGRLSATWQSRRGQADGQTEAHTAGQCNGDESARAVGH